MRALAPGLAGGVPIRGAPQKGHTLRAVGPQQHCDTAQSGVPLVGGKCASSPRSRQKVHTPQSLRGVTHRCAPLNGCRVIGQQQLPNCFAKTADCMPVHKTSLWAAWRPVLPSPVGKNEQVSSLAPLPGMFIRALDSDLFC